MHGCKPARSMRPLPSARRPTFCWRSASAAFGYIYVLDGKGIIRVHPKVELRGADLTGHAFIREQLSQHSGYLEYQWANPGKSQTRPKALYMSYFAPWDWIISVSSYRDKTPPSGENLRLSGQDSDPAFW